MASQAISQNRRDKEFPKQKLMELMTTKPALQEVLKGTLSRKEKPKVTKTRKEQRQSTGTAILWVIIQCH